MVATHTHADETVRLFVYRFFLEHGRPPMPVETAVELGMTSAQAAAAVRRLADDHLLVLAPGTPYIWMANPLCALPSPFAVRADGRDWYGVCIWDALGVVAMLGGDGTVSTRCPDCGEVMLVDVRDGGVTGPEGAVVHFAVPARQWTHRCVLAAHVARHREMSLLHPGCGVGIGPHCSPR